MKKMKRALVVVLSLVLIPMLMIGCSLKPKVSADETAKILFDFYIKGDESGLSKIGVPKNIIDETVKLQKDTFSNMIKANFSAGKLTIKDEQIAEMYKWRSEALKKVTVTSEAVNKTDTYTEVKIKSTYINEGALDEKAVNDAIEAVKKLGLTNEKDATDKLTEAYINNLIKEYKEAKPSTETKEKTFKFTIQEKVWMPENMSDFGTSISKLSIGMN